VTVAVRMAAQSLATMEKAQARIECG